MQSHPKKLSRKGGENSHDVAAAFGNEGRKQDSIGGCAAPTRVSGHHSLYEEVINSKLDQNAQHMVFALNSKSCGPDRHCTSFRTLKIAPRRGNESQAAQPISSAPARRRIAAPYPGRCAFPRSLAGVC